MGAKQAKKGEVCRILEESQNGWEREWQGGQSYFSLYSCLVFMVFDRAWSLSPSVSLSRFTFSPILEVAALLLVTFSPWDLIFDCFFLK